jgi:hypothetical protein
MDNYAVALQVLVLFPVGMLSILPYTRFSMAMVVVAVELSHNNGCIGVG